jgi:hypothetical protein
LSHFVIAAKYVLGLPLRFRTIPKACDFEAATLRVAGVSPARHAGILPDVRGSLIPIVVYRDGDGSSLQILQ